ncbi:capsule biosynthesis protein CapA [Campylobacter sp.]|uniref:capsule biosynthesis protein CapA n=1 Tax=Campylobacter sp. TaxID=205 RepID=UPI0026DBB3F5|nr:capsule biosynthesis protein CapA [Campylobacter sp.]MDO4674672.1 capsule biosynthesis protein CapA [Campylobacter sp.]
MKPLIIGGRDDGFGERMRALLNAMYVARRFGLEWGFVWRDFDWGEDFLDGEVKTPIKNLPKMRELFSEDFIARYHKSELSFSYITPTLYTLHQKSIHKLLSPPFEEDWGWYMTQGDLDTYFSDVDSSEYRKSLVSCFESIAFSKRVEDIFQKAKDTAKTLGDFTALHLRSGETVFDEQYIKIWWHCRYKIFAYPLGVAAAFDELQKGRKLVLFSDDYTLLEALREYFICQGVEDKIFIASSFTKDLSGYEALLFELMLMSRARTIFCSWTTGFARCACYIGNNELINIHEHYSLSQSYEAMIKFIDLKNIHPNQAAFSYFFLYLLARDLGLPFEAKERYLKQSLALHSNENTKVFLLDLLLEHGYFEEAEASLEAMDDLERMGILKLLTDYPLHPTYDFHIFARYFIAPKYKHLSRFAFEIFLAFSDENSQLNAHYPYFKKMALDLFAHTFAPTPSTPLPSLTLPKRHCLAYVLGKTMIENSHSFWGYIRMPYVLSYVKERYLQEAADLKARGEYYDFYEDGHSLSFQLGSALIKAHKNRYIGGYLHFIFIQVPQIKKNFKKVNDESKKH